MSSHPPSGGGLYAGHSEPLHGHAPTHPDAARKSAGAIGDDGLGDALRDLDDRQAARALSRRARRGLSWLLLVVPLVAAAPAHVAAQGLDPLLERLGDPSAREVVQEATLVRPPLAIAIRGSLETYEFLLDRPAFAAAVAKHLHPPLSYRAVVKGRDIYEVDDGGLLRGELRLLATAGNRRVYLGNGQARSLAPLIRLTGRMVVLLEFRPGTSRVDPSVDTTSHIFLRLEGGLMKAMAKALAPLIWRMADRRITTLGDAAGMVATRIASDPRSLYAEMKGWTDLRAEDVEAYRKTFAP